jgi:hypothetical protein
VISMMNFARVGDRNSTFSLQNRSRRQTEGARNGSAIAASIVFRA